MAVFELERVYIRLEFATKGEKDKELITFALETPVADIAAHTTTTFTVGAPRRRGIKTTLKSYLGSNVCPPIISRGEWEARRPDSVEYIIFPVNMVIIHHTVTPQCYTRKACSAAIRSMQNYHIDSVDYGDIGYNFLIGGDGNVYEGRGWHKQGAHTYRYNSKSIGIAFIGDFTKTLPSDKSMNAAKQLLACGVAQGELTTNYQLLGAKQLSSTESPGFELQNRIRNWEHFSEYLGKWSDVCPPIVTRREWDARKPDVVQYIAFPINKVIIHHTVTRQCFSIDTCAASIRSMQNYHIDQVNLDDISYNFLIGGDGNVYEGRGWHKEGAHTRKYNSKSIGIAFIGDFTRELPSDKALNATKALLACGVAKEELTPNYLLYGAKQLSRTQSPGYELQSLIRNWDHFND
ncbi:hypothetical protein FQA39_LY10130 [Lamprigera yunnana]|nr:hypothetical protein FQA39_LY10130 [Lamprigera yunnana]